MPRSLKLKTLLGLILCNLIWSAHPVMGKLVLLDFSPSTGAWLRYATALLAYWGGVNFLRMRGIRFNAFLWPAGLKSKFLVAFLGFMTFCFSPLLQMTGLARSLATDNSLIIAMEPLMTVGLAWLVLRESVRSVFILAFVGALAGFFLLSGMSTENLAASKTFVGDAILLISLTGEAAFSVLARLLTAEYEATAVFGSALVSGVFFLTLSLSVMHGIGGEAPLGMHLGSGLHLEWKSLAGILWLGPLGTAATYLYWMVALAEAPVASLAITLFIQPVFGSLLGYFFMGDRLTSTQVMGGGLILVSVMIPSLLPVRLAHGVRGEILSKEKA